MSVSTVDLQNLLNKVGGILIVDGKAGNETNIAIRDARAAAGLPPGGVDDALIGWLTKQPDPSPIVPTESVVFIARQEVSSRPNYDARCAKPTWPGGDSGITIGIGYDLRFQGDFESCWAPRLQAATAAALRPWIGKPGTQAGAVSLAAYSIPFFSAWDVFAAVTLPKEVQSTAGAFGDLSVLPPLCRGALVSLVYNRGPSLGLSGDPDGKRREMLAIRNLIQAGQLDQVPAEFASMLRLWPDAPGLRARRLAEADMWKRGLAQAAQSSPAPTPTPATA